VTIDSAAILRLLPHRHPFVLVDRVVELGDDYIIAYKNVSRGDPLGIDPATRAPILPRPMVIEAVGQAALCLVAHRRPAGSEALPLFVGCDCTFEGDVPAGCRLDLEARIEKAISRAAIVVGRASVRGRTVAEMRLSAALAEVEAP
jgi:3-hydroxyacyl-[acyl-carrier-protein] dehydratase